MCGGGTPKKPEPTASELESLRIAELNQAHHRLVFKPLELDAIDEGSRVNLESESNSLRGRVNADIAIANQQNGLPVVSLRNGKSQFITDVGDTTNDVATVATQADIAARKTAQGRFTDKKLNVVKTGRDMARSVTSGLEKASDRETATAITNLRNKNNQRNANLAALTTLAGGVAQGLALKKQQEIVNSQEQKAGHL